MRVVAFNGSARKGGNTTFSSSPQMIVPGSSYWNIGVGREIGDVEKDEEGVATMRTLGRNMAWLLKRLNGGEG